MVEAIEQAGVEPGRDVGIALDVAATSLANDDGKYVLAREGRTLSSAEMIERVTRWAAEIRGRGACHHPDGAARFVESALTVFRDELVSHQQRTCAGRRPSLPLGNGGALATGAGR